MSASVARVVIIDYKMGNLNSVANALRFLGVDAAISDRKEDVLSADALILPGVGAFGEAMKNLANQDLISPLRDCVVGAGVPFLGICLGMQLIAESSDEMGHHEGLGWLPGHVRRLVVDSSLRVPHIGWNRTEIAAPSPLFENLEGTPDFYYVHSYHLETESRYVAAWCDYGMRFASAVQSGNISAVQFHPEKSQHNGLRVLRNFTRTFDRVHDAGRTQGIA